MNRVRAARRALWRALRRTPSGAIDIPAAGALVSPGRLEIIGWALLRDRLVGTIEIRVDGRDAGCAQPFSMPRPDVEGHTRGPGAAVAGFGHVVTIPEGPGRRVRIDADVVDVDGGRHPLAPVVVDVGGAHSQPVIAGLVPVAPVPHPHAGRPTRVTVFTNSLAIGGGPLYLQDILRPLLREGAISCVVISRFDGPLRAELEELGATVHVVEFPVWSGVAYEATVRLLSDVVRYHDPDVVLVNSMPAAIGADLATRLRVPVAWAIHESYTLDDLWRAAYGEHGLALEVRARLEWGLANSALLIFEADATRRVYEPAGAPGRAVTIRYGVSVDAINRYRATHSRDAVRRSLGLQPTARALLCMGTFEPRKAQASIALAFAEIAREYPDAVLVLVGDLDGSYSTAVHQVVEQSQLTDRVHVVPVVDDPMPWYFAADGFVSASDIESMPRSMLEAMAFEVPVAAAAVWGVPELVEHGRNGLLFESRDLRALRDALRALLELTPDEAQRLGAAAAESVAAHFDDTGYIEAYRKLLPGLAARPDADPHELVSDREPVA